MSSPLPANTSGKRKPSPGRDGDADKRRRQENNSTVLVPVILTDSHIDNLNDGNESDSYSSIGASPSCAAEARNAAEEGVEPEAGRETQADLILQLPVATLPGSETIAMVNSMGIAALRMAATNKEKFAVAPPTFLHDLFNELQSENFNETKPCFGQTDKPSGAADVNSEMQKIDEVLASNFPNAYDVCTMKNASSKSSNFVSETVTPPTLLARQLLYIRADRSKYKTTRAEVRSINKLHADLKNWLNHMQSEYFGYLPTTPCPVESPMLIPTPIQGTNTSGRISTEETVVLRPRYIDKAQQQEITISSSMRNSNSDSDTKTKPVVQGGDSSESKKHDCLRHADSIDSLNSNHTSTVTATLKVASFKSIFAFRSIKTSESWEKSNCISIELDDDGKPIDSLESRLEHGYDVLMDPFVFEAIPPTAPSVPILNMRGLIAARTLTDWAYEAGKDLTDLLPGTGLASYLVSGRLIQAFTIEKLFGNFNLASANLEATEKWNALVQQFQRLNLTLDVLVTRGDLVGVQKAGMRSSLGALPGPKFKGKAQFLKDFGTAQAIFFRVNQGVGAEFGDRDGTMSQENDRDIWANFLDVM